MVAISGCSLGGADLDLSGGWHDVLSMVDGNEWCNVVQIILLCAITPGIILIAVKFQLSEKKQETWLKHMVPTSFLFTNVVSLFTSHTHNRELNLKVNRSWITIKFTHRCEPYWFRYSFYWKLCVNYHWVQFIVEVYYPALRHKLLWCRIDTRESRYVLACFT